MTTAILFATLVGGILLSIVLWGVLLRVGLGWARVPEVGHWPILKTTLVVILLQMPLSIAIEILAIESPGDEIWLGIFSVFVVGFLIPCIAIMRFHKTTFGRATLAWLPTLLASVVMFAIALFVFRGFLFEAFTTPSNSMAPTILGEHWKANCSTCGSPAYCSPRRPQDAYDPQYVICRDHFHITAAQEFIKKAFQSDRFMVAKFLKPKRWDIIAFQNPADPDISYLSRLVGLPGEEITIVDHQIYANGELLALPESIREIEYWIDGSEFGRPLWGTKETPARLGADEYFVLGDFSPRSMDSRLWTVGAPGHPAYAVPASYIRGPVSHIFWPPSRWRAFR